MLRDVAQDRAGEGRHTLVLVQGEPGEEAEYADIAPFARVAVESFEPEADTLAHRYAVNAFPCYLLLRDGVLAQDGWSLRELGMAPAPRPEHR